MPAPDVGLLTAAPAEAIKEAICVPYCGDPFFVGDEGLISVWDFDFDTIIDFETRARCATFMMSPHKWLSCICCYPCLLRKNVEWETKAQHLALTVDGVKYTRDKHPRWCGLSCTDGKMESSTVPYDKIVKCDVQEPSGTVCCCIKNVLTSVRFSVKTEPPVVEANNLCLRGLKHPNAFKQAVYTMKHSEMPSKTAMKSESIDTRHLSERNRMLAMLLKKFPSELVKHNECACEAP